MKNLLSVFATLMMVLFAAGCSNNDDMVVASQDSQIDHLYRDKRY